MRLNMSELMDKVTVKPYDTVMLPIDKLKSNPANFYALDSITHLMDSILMAGRVLQNITVKPADKGGHYMIISGHRRCLACRRLVEQGYKEFEYIPAIIETEKDESLLELMVIYSNSTGRELSDAEKMHQARRATEILYRMKDRGEFSGQVRRAAARMLHTTETQLARYAAIADNLKNEAARKAFDDGRMGVSAAYEASRLSAEGQKQVADKLAAGEKIGVQDVKDIKTAEIEAEEAKKVKLFAENEKAELSESDKGEETRGEAVGWQKTPGTAYECKSFALERAWAVLRAEYERQRRKYDAAQAGGWVRDMSMHNAAMMYLQGLLMSVDDAKAKLKGGK